MRLEEVLVERREEVIHALNKDLGKPDAEAFLAEYYFLLQELHREFNTMGSKIGQADTSHRIVDVKSELEKIREQIQNVE